MWEVLNKKRLCEPRVELERQLVLPGEACQCFSSRFALLAQLDPSTGLESFFHAHEYCQKPPDCSRFISFWIIRVRHGHLIRYFTPAHRYEWPLAAANDEVSWNKILYLIVLNVISSIVES